MACTFNLIDELGGTPSSGGTWTETSTTTPDYETQGGTITNGDQGTVDFTGINAGTYTFEYDTGGVCNDQSIVTVTVVDGANAGADASVSQCTSDNTAYVLFTLLGGTPDNNGTWSGTAITSAGYSDLGTPTDPTDDTFNPSLVPAGTYTAIYTVDNSTADTPAGCDNCTATATITITVSAALDAGIDGTATVCN